MVRLQLDPSSTQEFIKYIESCITSEAKTIDLIKEYIIAKLCQSVLHKLQTLLLKYKQASSYKTKSIQLSELEITALYCYFSRYQVHSYLIPLEQAIMDGIRVYPQLLDVLAANNNSISWQNFIAESNYVG